MILWPTLYLCFMFELKWCEIWALCSLGSAVSFSHHGLWAVLVPLLMGLSRPFVLAPQQACRRCWFPNQFELCDLVFFPTQPSPLGIIIILLLVVVINIIMKPQACLTFPMFSIAFTPRSPFWMPCLQRMVYGHRPRSNGETYREVLLQPAMRAVMPGDLEGSGDSPCFLGKYKRHPQFSSWMDGGVEVLGVSLANIQRLQSMCRCISQQKGGTSSRPANVTSRGTLCS